MKRSNMLLIASIVIVTALSVNGYAHAEATTSTLTNTQVETVAIAVVIGSLGAPIFGFATSEVNKAKGTRDPFDWGQYALAIIVILPAGLGLLLTELTTIQITGTGLQSIIVLFVMVFIQAIGLDGLKAGTAQAITNSAVPKPQ